MHSGIELQTSNGSRLEFDILDIFPFTSESKHIVIRDMQTGDITLLQKGADADHAVMAKIVCIDSSQPTW